MATIKNRKSRPITPSELRRVCPAGAETIRWEGTLRLAADKRNPDEQWWVDYRNFPDEARSIQGSDRRVLRFV